MTVAPVAPPPTPLLTPTTPPPLPPPLSCIDGYAYPKYRGYWSYGDLTWTSGHASFEECCEAAAAYRNTTGQEVDRFSFQISTGRCYYKQANAAGAEGNGCDGCAGSCVGSENACTPPSLRR